MELVDVRVLSTNMELELGTGMETNRICILNRDIWMDRGKDERYSGYMNNTNQRLLMPSTMYLKLTLQGVLW